MSIPVTKAVHPAEKALAQSFERALAALPGQESVQTLRKGAAALFATQGLPSRRVEAWHYSDLRARIKEALPLASQPDEAAIARAGALLQPVREG